MSAEHLDEPPAAEVSLEHYSRALDEIHRLRGLLAYEAQVTKSHLGYATFPKGRRQAAENQVRRMLSAAKGYAAAECDRLPLTPRRYLDLMGAPSSLTRHRWETSDPSLTGDGPPEQRPDLPT